MNLPIFEYLWQLAQAVHYKKIVHFQYCREFDEVSSERIVKLGGVIFSEYYFYLVAYQTKKVISRD
ncbi:WYL domain-containing protein [Solibacillus daqui]|uniref:WYL domain-containing protein n=1 Tax=Solibacillus daqui TaxID=2912187 RepID=UPI00236587DE|nr:WYL domain-containing protein [Solibacillus daqui]